MTPNSNGITDIVALGDTVWLGTDGGVSLTTDGGNSWTNFFGTPAFGSEGISALGMINTTELFGLLQLLIQIQVQVFFPKEAG